MADFTPTAPLDRTHQVDRFDCGSAAQTEWLRNSALQAQGAGSSRVFVTTAPDSPDVVGYFALAAGSVEHEAVSARVRQGVGRYPIPVVILARLGVDVTVQGRGVGRSLVRDALVRVNRAADEIGVRALLIHAETPEAKGFYRSIAEFDESPVDPLHLVLLMKDLRAALRQP